MAAEGVFGRKIIYRDIVALRFAMGQTGKISFMVCINRDGLVTYAEIITSETTIRDKVTLRKYLTAARGYKFQPDLSAPKEQCGKLKFIIENSINNKL